MASPPAGLVLVNGRVCSTLSVADRGLAYGDGLFETIRVERGVPVMASLHWQRLQLGLERLAIPVPIAEAQRQLLALLALADADGRRSGVAKLIVTRGEGGRGFGPPIDPKPSILWSWHPVPPGAPVDSRQGLELRICRQRLPHRPWLAGLKHLNCLEYVLARLELREGGEADGLLLDGDGLVIEATSANLFLVVGGKLITPALHRCGIMGTVRRWIIEAQAAELRVPVVEADLAPAALEGADEVFLCNSVIGICPVSRIDRWRWRPGPVTAALRGCFGRMLDELR